MIPIFTRTTDVNRITLPPSSNSKAQANGFHPGVLPDPRILILSVSPDLSTSYIPIMNAIFSAQKLVSPIKSLDSPTM
jgi:transcription initiation factor TFIIH subunit 3